MPENPVQPEKSQNKVGRQVLVSLKSESLHVFFLKKVFLKYDKIKRILSFKFRAHRWSLSL